MRPAGRWTRCRYRCRALYRQALAWWCGAQADLEARYARHVITTDPVDLADALRAQGGIRGAHVPGRDDAEIVAFLLADPRTFARLDILARYHGAL